MIWETYPNVTYCTPTRQSSGNWGRHAKQHVFLYQLWTTRALLNILLSPPNHDSQNSPNETHELGSWAKKWDDVPWAWTMGFDAFLCEYGLFWALEEIFQKSMIMLTWCGSPMKWNHVVWKFFPQHSLKEILSLKLHMKCLFEILNHSYFLKFHCSIERFFIFYSL